MSAIARGILKITANIAASAESTAGASNDHGPDLIVVAGFSQRSQDFMHHDLRIGIQLLGTVECDRGHMAALLVDDLFKFLHWPVNFGARFSMNARTPSLWS